MEMENAQQDSFCPGCWPGAVDFDHARFARVSRRGETRSTVHPTAGAPCRLTPLSRGTMVSAANQGECGTLACPRCFVPSLVPQTCLTLSRNGACGDWPSAAGSKSLTVVGRFAEMLCTQGFFVYSWQLQETNMARPSSSPSAFLDVLLTSPLVDPAPYIRRRPAALLPEHPTHSSFSRLVSGTTCWDSSVWGVGGACSAEGSRGG